MMDADNRWHIAIIDQQSGPTRMWRRALTRRYRLSFFESVNTLTDHASLDPDEINPDSPQLVILDWDGTDGEAGQFLSRLRRDHNNGLGVIAVVDEDDPDAALAACEMGCNEYLTRPLEESELSNRVVHLLRHRPRHPSLPEYYPPYRFDLNRRTVMYQGTIHRPRPREFDLMLYLLRRPEEVISRSQLKETVWFGESDDCRSIDTYISRIRRLYGLNGHSGWRIKSVYGTGYQVIATEPSDDSAPTEH